MQSAGDVALSERTEPLGLESPFAEAFAVQDQLGSPIGWGEALSPFADQEGKEEEGETYSILTEALAELRDEGFHEAVAFLAEETEQAVADRFSGEVGYSGEQQERFAQQYLSPVQFEAEQYLSSLEQGLAGVDLSSLGSEQLDEVLDRFDPQPGELTPAGEEFVKKFVKKARKAVSFVAKTAQKLSKLANPLIGPLLNRVKKSLKGLVRKVLLSGIGRLPAPLQPAARTLANRLLKEQETGEDEMSPAQLSDPEALADSFDFNLAEALAWPETIGELDRENYAMSEAESAGRDLEVLAEARGALIDQLGEGDSEAVSPAIEQFVPVALAALKMGIKLIGRPKIVNFLAKYLAGLIKNWVGKDLAAPLSRAIVDTGLRIATLEAESGEAEAGEAGEAAPVALASVIEDSVRRFAENEDYVLENEELAQVALAEAFGEAIATHFPQEHVREELQLAPSLGGTFITRRPRAKRSYAKYSRTPEIDVTRRLADSLPGFGGTTLGGNIRAAGGSFPIKARMHIYQMRPGSSLGTMLRHDRRPISPSAIQPLTRRAASALLREPALGTSVPQRYLRNRHRLAVGQRVYVLEPLGGLGTVQPGVTPRFPPGRTWLLINPKKSQITLGVYLSEADAQEIAGALRAGRGPGPLLSRLFVGVKRIARLQREEEAEEFEPPMGEEGEALEGFAAARGVTHRLRKQLRRRIASWALPALASWLRSNSDAFVRAAAHPDPGVTIRVRIDGIPGLAALKAGGGAAAAIGQALRGNPAISISVKSGRSR